MITIIMIIIIMIILILVSITKIIIVSKYDKNNYSICHILNLNLSISQE